MEFARKNITLQMNNLLDWEWRRRLPFVHQTESAECGVACLTMIAGWYGYRID